MPDLVELVAEEAGAEIARIEREFGLRVEAMLADCRASVSAVALEAERTMGELRLRLAAVVDGKPGEQGEPGPPGVVDMAAVGDLVRAAVEALPPATQGEPGRDGADADMAALAARLDERVTEAVRALPAAERGEPGQDADMGEVARLIGDCVREAVSALPAPEKGPVGDPGASGKDGHGVEEVEVIQDGALVELAFTVGQERSAFRLEVPVGPAGERGPEGQPGKMPIAKGWADAVHYEADVVAHNGATYQAIRDTGREPPHDDWICLAGRGEDGKAAAQLDFRGTYDPEAAYSQLNVVALNYASFVAKQDNPGPCPGDGWQLMAGQGKRGAPGEKGEKGDVGSSGPPGPPAAKLEIDDEGVLTLTSGDGSTVTCDLYPVLSRLG